MCSIISEGHSEAVFAVASAPLPRGETEGLPEFEALNERDIEQINRLMRGHRFDPSLMAGAGSRCRHGRVKVLVCRPFPLGLDESAPLPPPMPTSFWLICPHTARTAGTSESNGGVKRLEKWIRERGSDEWERYAQLHRDIRIGMMSAELRGTLEERYPSMYASLAAGGVGGIISPAGEIHVKCIHLQTASWLALGHHPGAEWLRSEGLDGECSACSC